VTRVTAFRRILRRGRPVFMVKVPSIWFHGQVISSRTIGILVLQVQVPK